MNIYFKSPFKGIQALVYISVIKSIILKYWSLEQLEEKIRKIILEALILIKIIRFV